MQFIQGDVINNAGDTDLFVIPCNAIINGNKLVMGAGIARTVRDSLEGVDEFAASLILKRPMPSIYGLVYGKDPKGRVPFNIGFLQVKNHYEEPASLLLLDYGLKQLSDYCVKFPDHKVDMPFPCIGHGGLTPEEVRPLLDLHLSKTNVNIWHL